MKSKAPFSLSKNKILDADGNHVATLNNSNKEDGMVLAAAPLILEELQALHAWATNVYDPEATPRPRSNYNGLARVAGLIAKAHGQ